jgi:hypothetical protein
MGIHGYVEPSSSIIFFSLTLASIYKEIGAGERIALSKYAVQHFEKTGRPLRIAIDISIWLFQIQSGKGAFLLRAATGGVTKQQQVERILLFEHFTTDSYV